MRTCAIVLPCLVAALVAPAARAQAPEGSQLFFTGFVSRAGSLSSEGAAERRVYVLWDDVEQQLSDRLPPGTRLELERVEDASVLVPAFLPDAVLDAAAIDALYAAPAEARRKAETLRVLQEIFAADVPDAVRPGPNPPAASLPVTSASFATVLRFVLTEPDYRPLANLLTLADVNVARARHRAFVEAAPAGGSGVRGYELFALEPAPGARRRSLGRVEVDLAASQTLGAPSRLEAVTSGLARCDAPEEQRAQGAVALTWDHPGLPGSGNVSAEALVSSLLVAGYDVYRQPGACPATPLDLAALAAGRPFGAHGALALPGLTRVNDDLVAISSPAPHTQATPPAAADTPDRPTGFSPRFAQLHDPKEALAAVGLGPGAPVCYHIAARDRAGQYGATASIATTVGDFIAPEAPWSVTVAPLRTSDGTTTDQASYLEWPEVSLDNWLSAYGGITRACSSPAEARLTGRLAVGALATSGDQRGDPCDHPRVVRLDAARYQVYRFESYEDAARFSDSDGDGYADAAERYIDTDGDGLGDTPEAALSEAQLLTYPPASPEAACSAASHPGGASSVIATLDPAADPGARHVGADGRSYLRWEDTSASLGVIYWYAIVALAADGRPSAMSMPVRAIFPDVAKPAPFTPAELSFQACEPFGFQDDAPIDLEADVAGGDFEPVTIDVLIPTLPEPTLESHRVLAVDLEGRAQALRVSCIDEQVEQAALEATDPLAIERLVAMRVDAYVGRLAGFRPVGHPAYTSAIPAVIPREATFGYTTVSEQLDVCSALRARVFPTDPAGGFRRDQCVPYVELLDGEGAPIGARIRAEIRDDGSTGWDGSQTVSCWQDPYALGCELFACNFMVVNERRCERELEPVEVLSAPFEVTTDLQPGECVDVEMKHDLPTGATDAQGRAVMETRSFRVERRCCLDADTRTSQDPDALRYCGPRTMTVTPPDATSELSCWTATKSHSPAGGGKGSQQTATSNFKSCIRYRPTGAGAKAARTPAPPRLVSWVVPADGTTATLTWSSEGVPFTGAVIEWWSDEVDFRRSAFESSLGRSGHTSPIATTLALPAALPTGATQSWCVRASAVGADVDASGSAPLSDYTAPFCVTRARTTGPPPPYPAYIAWPPVAAPRLLDATPMEVDYLWYDGVPFIRLGALAVTPNTPAGTDPACSPGAGCLPPAQCQPHDGYCLAAIFDHLPDGSGTRTTWTKNAVATSKSTFYCQDVRPLDGRLRDAVVYRQARASDDVADVGPWVQVSELLPGVHCAVARTAWRQLDPSPVINDDETQPYGVDDPHFEVLRFPDDAGGVARLELVFLDRTPHAGGSDYRYQIVRFDDRGEIAGYYQTKWLVHHGVVSTNDVWIPEGGTP